MSKLDDLRLEYQAAQKGLAAAQDAYRAALRGLRLVEQTKADTGRLEALKGVILDQVQKVRSIERAILAAEIAARPDPVPRMEALSPRAREIAEQIQRSIAQVIEIGTPDLSYVRMHEGSRSAPVLMQMFPPDELPIVTAFGDACRNFTVELGLPVRTPPEQVPELVELWARTEKQYEFEPVAS